MPVIASLLAATIPMMLYLIIIWRMDKYEQEPLISVFYHFFWGAVGAVVLALIGDAFLSYQFEQVIANPRTLSLLETILIAPFVEEITKGIFLVITVANIKFDNLTDGLVYGGAIGLGFGMTENFLYFLSYGNTFETWVALVIIRSGFSAVMHCIATATFGAFLGIAKFSTRSGKLTLPFVGLFSAMLIHFLWNFSVSFESTYTFGFIFLLTIVILFIVVFSISLRKERKVIISELLEEVDLNVLPRAYVSILSTQKRRRSGWFNEDIRKDFIKVAIKLAFRKTQYKNTLGKNKQFYLNEIIKYRAILKEIIEKSMSTFVD